MSFKKTIIIICFSCILTAILTHKARLQIEEFKGNLFPAKIDFKPISYENNLQNDISLEISNKNYNTLLRYKEEAISRGKIGPKQKEEVKVNLIYNDEKFMATASLKGDNLDHINSNKISLKIKGRNGTKFTIQHPKTRSYLYEWILHKAFRKVGIPTTEYDFSKVTINNTERGIYAIEHSFDKTFFTFNQIDLGPIVKFDEERIWQEYVDQGWYTNQAGVNLTGTFKSCNIESYSIDFPHSESLNKKAIDIIDRFRRNELKDIWSKFDLQKWVDYFAIVELFGGNHAANWHNIRFYFNSKSGKIIPIGYDGSKYHTRSFLHDVYRDQPNQEINASYWQLFFNDPQFIKRYTKRVIQLISNNFSYNLINEVKDDYFWLRKELQREFNFNTKIHTHIIERGKYLKTVYSPKNPLSAITKDKEKIMIGNTYCLPLKILRLKKDDETLKNLNVSLAGKSRNAKVDYVEINYTIEKWKNNKEYKIEFKILGNDTTYSKNVIDFYNP